ncbi:methyltransferase domain-containing protein [Radiobacillus kanasensis]|uniref:class I SAM-dependent DNA methyltransferase n=1 Tax=Radiobacillus kanasensis TaxID=2844358 RepID=UPI001E62689A|nr:class I SAM-dependent methyltransferase [Radiobacillus kanasensis]UFU00410.1 methyltransferase domain-containing protein [Radiobacillus kanasensis]
MGREFIDLFNDWAESYDQTVTGHDPQYRDVFDKYDTILEEVASQADGNVLEFGVGTGNLSKKLMDKGHYVIGVEPSRAMREEASAKYPNLTIHDGDFLSFPKLEEPISTIVSTYAFHHLTDEEKGKALAGFRELLPIGGKVVFADTAYESEETKQTIFEEAKEQGFKDLLYDLSTEYYPMLSVLEELFESNGFNVSFQKMNKFVWLMVAEKIS